MNAQDMILKRFKALIVKRPGFALGLWGAAGIGKTHTLKKLLLEVQFDHFQFHATTPLSELAGGLPTPKQFPIWALRSLEQIRAGIVLGEDQTVQTLAHVLRQSAPCVLYLEDIHEANDERLVWIKKLAQAVIGLAGVALVVTSRSEPPKPFEAIHLEPLNFETQKNLLETQIGAKLPAPALEWIQGKAAGNPLFTLEFFRFLTRQGFLWNDSVQWHWRVPDQARIPASVEALIERVLTDALQTSEIVRCLEARALLGHDPSLPLWHGVANLSMFELAVACEQLERHNILHGTAFAHPLFAEVTQQRIPNQKKQEYARRAILFLRGHDPIAAVAFLESANLEPEDTQTLLWAAADQARDLGQDTLFARFKVRIIPFLKGLEREELTLETASQLRHTDVLEALRLAETLLDSKMFCTDATLLASELHAVLGRGLQAEKMLEHLPTSQRQSSPWYAKLIWIRALGYNEPGALEILGAHPEALEFADTETLYRAARALANNGRSDQAQQLVDQALTPDLPSQARVWLLKANSIIAFTKADFSKMEQLELEVFKLASELGNLRLIEAATYNRAIALDVLGRQEERLACLDATSRTCLELNDLTAYFIAQVMYADSLHQTAHFEQAETMLLETLSQLERVDLTLHRVQAELYLAVLYQDWQPPQGKLLALKYAKNALDHAYTLGANCEISEALSGFATVLAWTGEASQALAHALEGLERAKQLDMPVNVAVALQALGYVHWKLEQPQAALEAYLEAQNIVTSYGHQSFIERLGVMIDLLTHKPERARERLKWFEAKGLVNAANKVKELFPESISSVQIPVTQTSQPRLEVLGAVQVRLQDQPLPIRGRKRLELLALLLEARIAGRSEIHRLEILNMLYPNESDDRANSSLKNLISHIRNNLNPETIKTTPNGYALGNLTSDAEEFLVTGNTDLWRGAYLENTTLEQGFESVKENLCETLHHVITRQLQTKPKEAARVARILLSMDSYNITYLALCLQALRASDNHKSLNREYNTARASFLEVGEVLPERWQDFLGHFTAQTTENLTVI